MAHSLGSAGLVTQSESSQLLCEMMAIVINHLYVKDRGTIGPGARIIVPNLLLVPQCIRRLRRGVFIQGCNCDSCRDVHGTRRWSYGEMGIVY